MTCCHVTILLQLLTGFHEPQALGYIYLANCVTSSLPYRLRGINMHIITWGFILLRASELWSFTMPAGVMTLQGQHIQLVFKGRVYSAIYFKTGLPECSWRAGSVSLAGNGLILLLDLTTFGRAELSTWLRLQLACVRNKFSSTGFTKPE